MFTIREGAPATSLNVRDQKTGAPASNCVRGLTYLTWRGSLVHKGRVTHDALFFTHDCRPIPNIGYPYDRWRKTLRRLPLRYRKPYTARHTSVSWNLMLGKNPLWVALQHGHRIATMLSVYAAWVEGARECDIAAIRRAMGYEKQRLPSTTGSLLTPVGELLTGWGTESERFRIRIRLDGSANGTVVWPAETRPIEESRAEAARETERPAGQRLASGMRLDIAKSLKGLKKTGGADGTRTRWAQAKSVTC